jgi:hypothetical protein
MPPVCRCCMMTGLHSSFQRTKASKIPRGSSLSPLLGAFYLLELDQKMEKLDVKCFRYMDDILISATTRWKLKKAIRMLNHTFNELKLEKPPDKTLIGRTERGFDFLGYFLRPRRLEVSGETVNRFSKRIHRLYEQGADHFSIGEYVKRWSRWVTSGGTGCYAWYSLAQQWLAERLTLEPPLDPHTSISGPCPCAYSFQSDGIRQLYFFYAFSIIFDRVTH